jgi:hypothetical protein
MSRSGRRLLAAISRSSGDGRMEDGRGLLRQALRVSQGTTNGNNRECPLYPCVWMRIVGSDKPVFTLIFGGAAAFASETSNMSEARQNLLTLVAT